MYKNSLVFTVLLLQAYLIAGADITCAFECLQWNFGPPVIVSPRQIMVKTIYGFNMVVDVTDPYISQVIKKTGTWEPQNLRTFGRFVKQGDTIINVGAHIGIEAMVYGKAAGKSGKLYIFQPYSISHKIALENVYLNNLQDITTVYKIGASNRQYKGYILVNQANPSGSMVFNDQAFSGLAEDVKNYLNTWKKEEINIDKVDNVLPADVRANFALIDVERLELECLEGMKRVIENSPDLIMVVEWSGYTNSENAKEYQTRARALIEWLAGRKYKFYKLNRSADNPPKNCDYESFIEMNVDQVMEMSSEMVQTKSYIDMIMSPSHLDPNSLY